MRRRSRYVNMNLDSLMDTLTNVTGVLMVALATVQCQTNVTATTRSISEADVEQARVHLEELEKQLAAVKELARSLGALDDPERLASDWQRQIQRLRDEIARLRKSAPTELPPVDIAALEREVADLEQRLAALRQKIAAGKERLSRDEQLLADLAKASEEVGAVRLPQLRELPQGYEPILFFCRYGRVYWLDLEMIQKKVDAGVMAANHGSKSINQNDFGKVVQHFEQNDVGDANIRIKLENLIFTIAFVLEARPGKGESDQDIGQVTSLFGRKLGGANKSKQFFKFIVWDDSFAIYLAARVLAEKKEFRAGWEAFGENEEFKGNLIGGGGGVGRQKAD